MVQLFLILAVISIIITVVVTGIGLALTFLPITLGLVAIWIVINLIRKANKEKQERLEKAEQERQFEEEKVRYKLTKQEGYYKEMVSLRGESINLFESLPKYLKKAEEYLDQAEVDFSDGAFAPF